MGNLLGAIRSAGPLPDLGGALRRLENAADEIQKLVSEPVRLALIGRYSSGKSRLIGTLLGNPALLPSEWDPTTGNVTVLRLHACDAVTATRRGTQVHFLSQEDLTRCITSMARSIAAMLHDLGAPAGLDPAGLQALDPTDVDALRGWLERAWRLNISPLRTRAAEFSRLLGAYESGRDLLGAAVAVDDAVLREVSAIKNREHVEEADDLPAPPVRPVRRGERLTARTAEAVFDLVDHIEITVDVPHGSWGAELLGDGGLIYDFPGAGNHETGMRDRYLARRDLREVTVSLVAIDAGLPHDHAPFQMIEDFYSGGQSGQNRRDHGRLACGTKADLITQDALRLGQTARPLTAAALESQAPQLAALVNQCRKAQPGGRSGETLLVSAYYHADPGEGYRLDHIADLLREDLPSYEGLAAALAALGADGGVARLREAIGAHVTAHGLALAAEAVGKQVAAAAVAAKDVANLLEKAAGSKKTSLKDKTGALELQRLAVKLRSDYGAVKQLVEEELCDLNRRPYGDGRTLVEITEAAVARTVTDWTEWEPLFSAVRGGVIVPEEAGDELAATTEPFRKRFLETYDDFDTVIDGIARDVLEAWRREQTDRMAEARTWIARAGVEHPELAKPLAMLAPYAELPWVAEIEPVTVHGDDSEPQERFPLREDYMLPWHIDAQFSQAKTKAAMRHQIHIRRIHRELTSALVDLAADRLADTLHATAGHVKAEFGRHGFPTLAELRAASKEEPASERRSPYADLIDLLRSYE
ncbi:hypothetical protein [Sinosporangium album]|uniref:hypothetical protein n=1 Tax=Sinosporangium album TaxID=504805 RepID=UPI0015A08A31|nr:hypothetical protein [Sinosporangium album]